MVTEKDGLGAFFADLDSLCCKLTKAEEIELHRRIEVGDKDARNRLIESVLPWVVNRAKIFQGRGIPLEELIAEASFTVVSKIDNFNPTRGRITTWATWEIFKQLSQTCRQNRSVIRRPYNATPACKEAHARALNVVNDTSPLEYLEDGDDPQATAIAREEWEAIVEQLDKAGQAFRKLAALPKAILRARLAGGKLTWIGPILGRSRERIRQVEERAMTQWWAEMGIDEPAPSVYQLEIDSFHVPDSWMLDA